MKQPSHIVCWQPHSGGMRRRAAGNEADTLFYETDKEKVKYAWQIRKNW
ncbi:hypothetical protein [Agathobaculum desmolans]|jgi:hypothetical protein|nr:hypothetical protein [Agathobaculum desmolans]